ncbi:FHA domain-containing protein [Streptomyces sp. NPDC059909]|uniref:FHA domain-containing protein n=1 Tax=Streptomyces sp. NPDC059909 TaxID=3346998 RepID=UPI003648653C
MQIRLTVLAPRSGQSTQGTARVCDVLVTAPAGTALAAVASGLAAAVSGPEAPGPVVLYAGRERLDAQRCALGEPPLVDGAVLSLQAPADGEGGGDGETGAQAQVQLHVVAGPDAGGVHLLHGGQIRVGRSAEADVPLDDPDVSRLHCAVIVADDGAVTVADLGSTNGTTLDGAPVGPHPVRLPPGALLRIGESTLRLAPPTGPAGPTTTPDGEGHLRVGPSQASAAGPDGPADHARSDAPDGPEAVPYGHEDGRTDLGGRPVPSWARADGATAPGQESAGTIPAPRAGAGADGSSTGTGTGSGAHAQDPARRAAAASWEGRAPGGRYAPGAVAGRGQDGQVPGGAGPAGGHPAAGETAAGWHRADEGRGASTDGRLAGSPAGHASDPTHGGRGFQAAPAGHGSDAPRGGATQRPGGHTPGTDEGHRRGAEGFGPDAAGAYADPAGADVRGDAGDGAGGSDSARRGGRRTRGESGPRKRGIGAWARRLAGARPDAAPEDAGEYGDAPVAAAPLVETWPDPAAVLLTALGPGPRLWERGPGHPEELAVRLGTADRADTHAVPVTVGLREAGSLGLAGPRSRLAGLARSVVAQLAALHAPGDLEIVLISTDRARSLEERRRDWSWLGWLPHLRPTHGQDCRLLVAYDRDQATARTAELIRRLDDGPLGPGWPSSGRRMIEDAAARHTGPRTVVILDGDPGSAALRETTARLAGAGAAGGIHVVCLAETPAASPLSPVAATYEEACAASLAFRECGAVALLSGDVATAFRLLRTASGRPAGHGTVGAVDAVSAAWAERFGRALAPLRAADVDGARAGAGTGRGQGHGRAVASPLPRSARLLDELGLARATPASLMARWASAADGTAVLGAGPRGPVSADLTAEGPHLLIEGSAGSGRTELLRAVAASLAAAGRPDRLGLLLVDGAGGERGEGLAACTELPHVTEHLVASDPVRMREFAQALGAELKRRAELLGRESFAEWNARREVADRLVAQRSAPRAESTSASTSAFASRPGRGDAGPQDVESPDSGALRLRARAALAAGERGSAGQAHATGPAAGAAAPQGRQIPSDDSRGADPAAASVSGHDQAGGPGDPSRQAGRSGGPEREAPPLPPLPRLVVLVDDYDALVAPALGSPGRPAAGSVVRALEAVAREGERLGVHLVATSARPDRTADTELARGARLRVVLDAPPASAGPEDPAPGRGRLGHPSGRVTPFQAGRVTGRIPRTATQRPTVVELEWERMGDPPTRRPVRELGNGPTDLALLASALDRAARSVDATPLPPLTPSRS